MERANPFVLIIGLILMALVWGMAGWLQDGLYIAKHEGDAIHLLDILMRMEMGQTAHVDFLTPIGSMAFKPIVWLMGPEVGAGRAFLGSQVLILAALIPAVFWIGISRLSTVQALCFGLIVTVLTTALVHGTSAPISSVSMHYNRWAWVFAFLAIILAILPPSGLRLPVLDGVIIGTCFAILALIKVTYVAAFVLPVFVALLLRRDWIAFVSGVVSGAVFLGVYTGLNGLDYWSAYLNDVVTVTLSDTRAIPSHPLSGVIAAPEFIGASIVVLLSVIFLRQSRQMNGGLVLLLLVPGFFYVTFQNFANDPQWLYVLPVILFSLRPKIEIRNGFGWNLGTAITYSAIIAMALAAPSFLNLAYSPFRHLAVDKAEYGPLLTDGGINEDIQAPIPRMVKIQHLWDIMDPGQLYADYASQLGDPPKALTILGEVMPRCATAPGFLPYFDKIAKDLEAAGFSGKDIIQTDVFSTVHWIYGEFPPLERGAPWSYGTEAGLGAADYMLVPLCPLSQETRGHIVESITRHPEVTLTEVHRGPLFILYRISKA